MEGSVKNGVWAKGFIAVVHLVPLNRSVCIALISRIPSLISAMSLLVDSTFVSTLVILLSCDRTDVKKNPKILIIRENIKTHLTTIPESLQVVLSFIISLESSFFPSTPAFPECRSRLPF